MITTDIHTETLDADLELLERISEGDERAFEALFNAYVPRLYSVVVQIVVSEAVVMDVIQDVFLKLWLNRERLGEVKVPSHYIFRMAYTQSFKHLRTQIRAERAHGKYHETQEHLEEDPDTPESIHVLAETRRVIEEAVTALPEQSRKIYRLSRHSGYKPQQIADQLGIHVQSVRNSLSRSAQAIRDYLAERGIQVPLIVLVWWLR